MREYRNLVGGIGAGLAAMYIMDPERGRRRRAVARDKALRQAHRASDGLDVAIRDLSHRARGLAARAKSRLLSREIDDSIRIARVRSKLGRLVSHPHAIEVLAKDGKIVLRGLVLSDEAHGLIEALQKVPGIHVLENQLKAFEREDHVPALQGGRPRSPARLELAQPYWSPSARLLVGTSALIGVLGGFRRRGTLGLVMAGSGLGLMIRAASNEKLNRFFGIGPGMIHVHKTIQIDAPIDDVFRFWSDFDNFPQFFPEVYEVQAIGRNRSRWSVAGPAGIPVRWRAITTRYELNEMISWKSEPGAIVSNAGSIRFSNEPDGGTRVEIDISYRPPAGRLGHALIKFFRADPKSRLDNALVRVKSLLERGPSRGTQRLAVGY